MIVKAVLSNEAPKRLAEKAGADREILLFIWDGTEGAYTAGFKQATIRPFRLGDGCDGSTDECIHTIAKSFCDELGLDYDAIYQAAYGEPRIDEDREDITILPIYNEAEIPPLTDETAALLLEDLYQINNRTLCEHLALAFQREGLEVDDY